MFRYKRLIGMSLDYLTWDGDDATTLYGIGKMVVIAMKYFLNKITQYDL
jgi:hypothetical protein